ncbi:hypothetical protein H9K76_13945 [Diaphorobacter ruginosibacter]|uniref:Uncharacterized protein n=1 Tax=Diaphorobacter ruginosibacter TaxID=1715720 RepID=A0A7G9RJE9_9BURK|nr:hypothetical protein [Diaphorobacter ruginosibacter]QNN55724.1 hypothetical protein H9K76_13945 [Diaphorobacter ruginosibacter]
MRAGKKKLARMASWVKKTAVLKTADLSQQGYAGIEGGQTESARCKLYLGIFIARVKSVDSVNRKLFFVLNMLGAAFPKHGVLKQRTSV